MAGTCTYCGDEDSTVEDKGVQYCDHHYSVQQVMDAYLLENP